MINGNALYTIKNEFFGFYDVFSSKKKVRSLMLNLFMIQPLRTLAAFFVSKYLKNSSSKYSNVLAKVLEDGFYVEPNFLDQLEFDNLQRECFGYLVDPNRYLERWYRTTYQKDVFFNHDEMDKYPYIKKFINNPKLLGYFKAVEGEWVKHSDIQISIEYLKNGENDDPDQNKEWHVDTFYSSHKAWLYLNDINSNSCPFNYVPKSHKINLRRLFYEYIWSIRSLSQGSSRLTQSDQDVLVKDLFKATGHENTFLIADTAGIHRRGDGVNGAERILVRLGVRRQPFFIRKK